MFVLFGLFFFKFLPNFPSSIQLFFLRKVVRQNVTDMMSLCMLFEKVGHGLLWVAFLREGDSSLHNIIFNALCLVFVLWSRLLLSIAFYFLRRIRRKLNTQLDTLHSFLFIQIASVCTEFSRTDPFLFPPSLSGNEALLLSLKSFPQ